MKIAVTADVHLTKDTHPERYNALEDILKQMTTENINTLIIAGDLFDKGMQNYAEFESLCSKYAGIEFHIVPGNHDSEISGSSITNSNVTVYSDPEMKTIGKTEFLFMPFMKKTMGQALGSIKQDLKNNDWVLVGHSDHLDGSGECESYEKGVYMPISNKDIDMYSPKKVLLGHIHKKKDTVKLHYPGSPCGLDINETGTRRFLILDTDDFLVEERKIDTETIYMIEKFTIIPEKDETKNLKAEITKRISGWNFTPNELKKVTVRLRASGYSTARDIILDLLLDEFRSFKIYKNESSEIIENLSESNDTQRSRIAEKVKKMIMNDLDWDFGGDEPNRDEVILSALSIIFGK